MTFIRDHQLSIMLFLSGFSALLTFTVLISKYLSRTRKSILALMAFSSTILLTLERFAYLYRGQPGVIAYYMVRISNWLIFFLLLFILNLVTQYLKDLLLNEGKLKTVPVSLYVCDCFFAVGAALLVVSLMTDLYYYIDANNIYHREPGIIISYFPPIIIVLLQEHTVIRHRTILSRQIFLALILTIALPTIAAIIQFLTYGISLVSIALAVVVIVYYIYMLMDVNEKAEAAKTREIAFYKEARRIEATMFEQTAEALVSAIDAKDIYTRGHSSRVAVYSRKIAERAGLTEKECEEVYFTALLHDVGKIGIPDNIINKRGRLTEAEIEEIKHHSIVGDQILAKIKQSPYLRIGAHYHHERYDGEGYPEGLSGENIPRIARIIAVADAFDAMTSTRSYRDALPMDRVKQELIDGLGKQFDPGFGQIMLKLIECGETAQSKPELASG